MLPKGANYGMLIYVNVKNLCGGTAMQRTAVNKLVEWKDSKNRKPLILWGARQVGKTYLAKKLFAEKHYKNKFIYVDFKIEDEIRDFCDETANPEKIIDFIGLSKGKKITADTLLVFDEIQECPNIISSLKYFCQDFRDIPVIATGSMVRIKLQREMRKRGGESKKYLFPVGKIDQMTIYPMTFDEYLLNANSVLYDTVKEAFEKQIPLEQSVHNLAMDYFYKYLLVGGMPEAVDAYLNGGSILETRKILGSLYENYLADMELYQASRESVLRSKAVFTDIYKELDKESKNFSPSLIESGAKNRDFVTAIDWLTCAHVINRSYQIREHITIPLIRDNDGCFRLFLCDVGMFSYQSGINSSAFISKDRENTLSGIFFENYVANELVAKGHKLFYWRGKNTAEFEFIIESDGKIYPIDVKKSKGALNSLKKFSEHNRFEYAIKVSRNNYGYDGGRKIMTLPLYQMPFLAEKLASDLQ